MAGNTDASAPRKTFESLGARMRIIIETDADPDIALSALRHARSSPEWTDGAVRLGTRSYRVRKTKSGFSVQELT